ncbi:MAG: hypothetical protein GQ570_04070 [Helicobacteraceae bacterium]|nr:hypothetical protein [Helicobacteraceae bacterium]
MGVKHLKESMAVEHAMPSIKATLNCLAIHANTKSETWVSVRTIRKETNLSDRSIRYALRSLKVHGFLTSETRKGKYGGQTSNLYKLSISAGEYREKIKDVKPTPHATIAVPPCNHCIPPLQPLQSHISKDILNSNSNSNNEGNNNFPEEEEMDIPKGQKAKDVIAKFANGKSPTDYKTPSVVGRMEKIWKENKEGFTKSWTGKERGQVKHFINAVGSNQAEKVFTKILSSWVAFAGKVKQLKAIKTVPPVPDLGFMLKYAEIAVNLDIKKVVEGTSKQPSSIGKPKHLSAKMPKGMIK